MSPSTAALNLTIQVRFSFGVTVNLEGLGDTDLWIEAASDSRNLREMFSWWIERASVDGPGQLVPIDVALLEPHMAKIEALTLDAAIEAAR